MIRGGRSQEHERSLRIWSNAPRVTTLDKLDEARRALANATVWSRSKVQPRPAVTDPDAPLVAATR